tara:strand:+ start:718 stop:1128 length:411 start_codon:yes stop_codon:yes gene_type:complete
MYPSNWGSHAWIFLHTISFDYPDNPSLNDKLLYKNFFHSLKNILPCPKCKKHYEINIKKYPIQLNSRLDLIHWLIKIHNEVNKSLHKKIYSFNEIDEIYQSKFNYSIKNNQIIQSNLSFYLLLFILSLLIIYYLKY